VDGCEVKLCCYNPIGGSGYKFITPPSIGKTKATLNIENNDDKCFLYCILAAKHSQANHAERVTKYLPYLEELNVEGLKFPITINQIPKFELQNESVSVNVLHLDPDGIIIPIYASKHRDRQMHVNLMLLVQGFALTAMVIKSHAQIQAQQNSRRIIFWLKILVGFLAPEPATMVKFLSVHSASIVSIRELF